MLNQQTFVASVDHRASKMDCKPQARVIPNLAGSKPNWVDLREHLMKVGHGDIVLIEDSCDTMTHMSLTHLRDHFLRFK